MHVAILWYSTFLMEEILPLLPPRLKANTIIRKRWENSRGIQAGIFGAAVVIGAVAGPYMVKNVAVEAFLPATATAASFAERALAARKSNAVIQAYATTILGNGSDKPKAVSSIATAFVVETDHITSGVVSIAARNAGCVAMFGLEFGLIHPDLGGAGVALAIGMEGITLLNPDTESAIRMYQGRLDAIDERVPQLVS